MDGHAAGDGGGGDERDVEQRGHRRRVLAGEVGLGRGGRDGREPLESRRVERRRGLEEVAWRGQVHDGRVRDHDGVGPAQIRRQRDHAGAVARHEIDDRPREGVFVDPGQHRRLAVCDDVPGGRGDVERDVGSGVQGEPEGAEGAPAGRERERQCLLMQRGDSGRRRGRERVGRHRDHEVVRNTDEGLDPRRQIDRHATVQHEPWG